MKIVLHDNHGGEHDVTEHVRSLYGHTTGSMDWGSGFLDTDEMLEVQEFGYLSGFESEDLDHAIKVASYGVINGKKSAEREAPYGRNIDFWERENGKRERFLAGLQRIRDARAQLFKQTDDVTGFDE